MPRNYLPPEIISHVLSYLDSSSLAPYAIVSKQWQAIIEKRTFSSLSLDTTQLLELARTVSRPRQHLIRQLRLKILSPEYAPAAREEVETDEDREQNNHAFTDAIHSLFKVLAGWSNNTEASLSLSIYARSPSDYVENSLEEIKRRSRNSKDLLQWRYESSYLQFLDSPETFPMVHTVGAFETCGNEDIQINRNIAPAAISRILSRLPRVRKVQGRLSDDERKNHFLRDKLRADFALSLSHWPTSIEHLDLNYRGWPPMDPNFPPLVRSDPGNDALSIALHCLSQQLVTLSLSDIMISPELFWPPGSTTESPPSWPKLMSYRLEYTMATPSGDWLFERDPRWVDSDWSREIDLELRLPEPKLPAPQDRLDDSWRTKPVQGLMTEFYRAASTAARFMPRLERMVLHAQLDPGARNDPEGVILDAGHWFMYDRARGYATWAGSGEFHLTEDIREAWRSIGTQHGNPVLRIQNEGYLECVSPLEYRRDEGKEDWKEDHGYSVWDD
ncbi:hypothetical protein BJX63DRAFT_83196 [Aspergillus granulosus]|uniref:F-box domain-containing protein n=1 Tax=Aspergillus granulosus TaxID=176169 RepID=A0ABR4HRG4_9EURO